MNLDAMFDEWVKTGVSMVELAKQTGIPYTRITKHFTKRLTPKREKEKKRIKYTHY